MATSTRISVTIPTEHADEVKSLVAAGRAASTSAFVKHAITLALADLAEWRRMLDDALQETGGPLTKKERDSADRILRKPNRAGR